MSADADIAPAFAKMADARVSALLVADDPFFGARRDQLIAQANSRALPAIYYAREFVAAGGLISYGSDSTYNYARGGAYVARILKGAPPAALPIEQPTKFELVINLKTAKALGLTVPLTLHAAAADVIE